MLVKLLLLQAFILRSLQRIIMEKLNTVFIALGSNKGDKLELLQEAIQQIHEAIGTISEIGNVYQTPALGFTGQEFLNSCIKITTHLSALECLKTLQRIEKQIGRVKTQTTGYEDRVIDLDIIYYNNTVIKTDKLIVPHPRMQERLFVLNPLLDVASNYEHPVFKQSTKNLIKICKDDSKITTHKEHLKFPKRIIE